MRNNSMLISDLKKISNYFNKISSNYCFEASLDRPVQSMDISLCILKEEIYHLLQYWEQKKLWAVFQQHMSWKKIQRFFELWADPDSPLFSNVSNIWFEFDNHQLNFDIPTPCLFLSPKYLYKQNSLWSGNKREPYYDWLFCPALATLIEDGLINRMKNNVKSCIMAIPEKGVIFQLGVMLSRSLKSIRICTGMSVDNYVSYLKKIGWTGSMEYLTTILGTLKYLADGILVDIDVGEQIYQKIGIECSFRTNMDIKPRLEKLLKYLLEIGLCIKENSDFVLNWICDQDKHYSDIIPESGTKRNLSHIKIVLYPDNSLEAKVYLELSKSNV